ncbi:hypothetical protein [Fervidibacillus halotolerans]|uniref:Uncharacterized protein n=1 Tax=Fervidibacillus halotolerans TaxID=2980027 RepID=A0A9E8M2G6_9BACI|nr:hypothetical protein [Fervidibacillus halotolerans]WAA13346.1 hypothetical protein OE105_04295 [Fervidibacillus halotolerans]
MESLKKMVPYLLICAIVFFTLPIFEKNADYIANIVIVFPLTCLIISIIFGIKNGFHFLFSIFVGTLFALTMFIHYNTSAWGYIIVYTIVAFIGNAIGSIFKKN